MKNGIVCQTPLGPITICATAGFITDLWLPGHNSHGEFLLNETPLLSAASLQLLEYFHGRRRVFDLPLAPAGTEFQKRVWAALQHIPYGETRSYQDIAISINNPRACRAVGQANHSNPIPIFIPCHRVIGAQGHLVGYGGGLWLKAYLLELERNHNSPQSTKLS